MNTLHKTYNTANYKNAKRILATFMITLSLFLPFSSTTYATHSPAAEFTLPMWVEMAINGNTYNNTIVQNGDTLYKMRIIIGNIWDIKPTPGGTDALKMIFDSEWKITNLDGQQGDEIKIEYAKILQDISTTPSYKTATLIQNISPSDIWYDHIRTDAQSFVVKSNLDKYKTYFAKPATGQKYLEISLQLDITKLLVQIFDISNPNKKFSTKMTKSDLVTLINETIPFNTSVFIAYPIQSPVTLSLPYSTQKRIAEPNYAFKAGEILGESGQNPALRVRLRDTDTSPKQLSYSLHSQNITAQFSVQNGANALLDCGGAGLAAVSPGVARDAADTGGGPDELEIVCQKWKLSETSGGTSSVLVTVLDGRPGITSQPAPQTIAFNETTIPNALAIAELVPQSSAPPASIPKGTTLVFKIARKDQFQNVITGGTFSADLTAPNFYYFNPANGNYETAEPKSLTGLSDAGQISLLSFNACTSCPALTALVTDLSGTATALFNTVTTITDKILPNKLQLARTDISQSIRAGNQFSITISPKLLLQGQQPISGNFDRSYIFWLNSNPLKDAGQNVYLSYNAQPLPQKILLTDNDNQPQITLSLTPQKLVSSITLTANMDQSGNMGQDITSDQTDSFAILAGLPAQISFADSGGTPIPTSSPFEIFKGTSVPIKILVKDAGGNPVSAGIFATFALSGESFSETQPQTLPTDAQGQISFTLTSAIFGQNNTLTVTINSVKAILAINVVSTKRIGSFCPSGQSRECNGGLREGDLQCVHSVCLGKNNTNCTDLATDLNNPEVVPREGRCIFGLYCSGDLTNGPANCRNDYGAFQARKTNLGSETNDIKIQINRVINIFLSFLAILGVIMVVYAGILWATAGGNDEQTGKAKKIIISSAIGLLIIGVAWTIISYVLNLGNSVS